MAKQAENLAQGRSVYEVRKQLVQSQGVLGRYYFNLRSIRHREFSPYQVHHFFSVSTNPVKPVNPRYTVASWL